MLGKATLNLWFRVTLPRWGLVLCPEWSVLFTFWHGVSPWSKWIQKICFAWCMRVHTSYVAKVWELHFLFLILSFHHVLIVICYLLGKSLASMSNQKNQQWLNIVSIMTTSSDYKIQIFSRQKPATWTASSEKPLKLRCIPITSTGKDISISVGPGGHYYEGNSISKLQIVIEKNRMEIMTYKQHLFFNIISIQI